MESPISGTSPSVVQLPQSVCAGPGLDVTEDDLDRLGVREDRDFNDNIVRRDPKITEERVETLSHDGVTTQKT